MNKQFTASGVHESAIAVAARDMEYEAEMLQAYADLLEAQEKAEPVATVVDQFGFPLMGWIGDAGDRCPVGTKLYTHPASADESEQTNDDVEQLRACREDWQKVCDVIHPGWHFNPEEIVEKLKAPSDAERLAEALRNLVEASRYADAPDEHEAAEAALAAHSAQAQPPAARVTDEMVMRLKHALPLFCADVTMTDARTALEAALGAQENPNG